MKSKKKVLVTLLCAALLVFASVMGTLAYLQDDDKAVNTFTVGDIVMSLDETDVDTAGVKDGEVRVKANAYHMMPGHEYTKDPIIHIDPTSENAWVFVKVENGIAAYEAATVVNGYTNIKMQIAANGWTALDGVDNVYWKSYTKGQEDKDLEVFENFKVSANANNVDGWSDIAPETHQIVVTGYAVQQDGFDTALDAWNATFGVK